MSRGITAFVFMAGLILSMSILGGSGIGYYDELGAEIDAGTYNDDVEAAHNALEGIDYNEDRSPAILQGPLAAVVPTVGILQNIKAVVVNTSGVLQLLFGIPPGVADPLQLFWRIITPPWPSRHPSESSHADRTGYGDSELQGRPRHGTHGAKQAPQWSFWTL